jgi:putative transposase
MKAWKKHPNNFIEMPKLTKYKNGEFLLVLTNQQCSIENGLL